MNSSPLVNWKKTLLLCAFILLSAGALTFVIFSTEPTAVREGAVKETAMLVDVTRVEVGTFRPVIEAMGTVRAVRDVAVSSRVGGEIVERSPGFTPGGIVESGDVLLRIDPSDYRNALEQRQGDLSQARASLRVEMARHDIAQEEYEHLFDKELAPENKQLFLRQPQLAAARAAVQAAQAGVNRARLDLQRTVIQAPFDAHVIRRDVEVGSQISPQTTLGRIVGIDRYWVAADIPLSKRAWILFPERDGEGSSVRIRGHSWSQEAYRQGRVDKLVGALDEKTRMAQVLITVEDPLARDEKTGPPLVIGEFVEARLTGKKVENVARLDRKYIRKNDTVWVMQDGRLDIRDLGIVLKDSEDAYVTSGLSQDDRVVVSNLATVTQGALLRTRDPDEVGSVPQKESEKRQ